MAKTIQTPQLPPQPPYEELPSWAELGRQAVAENERDPYIGPPAAQLVRDARDAR